MSSRVRSRIFRSVDAVAENKTSTNDTRLGAVVDTTTPTLVALAAVLILMAAVVFVLARPPSALEIEQDIWSAWLTFTVDEQDRRSFFAALTHAGRQRLRDSRPTHNDVIRERLTQRLTSKELKTLGALWEKVLDT